MRHGGRTSPESVMTLAIDNRGFSIVSIACSRENKGLRATQRSCFEKLPYASLTVADFKAEAASSGLRASEFFTDKVRRKNFCDTRSTALSLPRVTFPLRKFRLTNRPNVLYKHTAPKRGMPRF